MLSLTLQHVTQGPIVLCHTGSGMLQLIREVSAKVGKEEDAEDYKALERIIQSNNFKNVMEVGSCVQSAQ